MLIGSDCRCGKLFFALVHLRQPINCAGGLTGRDRKKKTNEYIFWRFLWNVSSSAFLRWIIKTKKSRERERTLKGGRRICIQISWKGSCNFFFFSRRCCCWKESIDLTRYKYLGHQTVPNRIQKDCVVCGKKCWGWLEIGDVSMRKAREISHHLGRLLTGWRWFVAVAQLWPIV